MKKIYFIFFLSFTIPLFLKAQLKPVTTQQKPAQKSILPAQKAAQPSQVKKPFSAKQPLTSFNKKNKSPIRTHRRTHGPLCMGTNG